MRYATSYDVGDRKREDGINEDSVAIAVFEDGHRDGYRHRPAGDPREADQRADAGDSGADASDPHEADDPAGEAATDPHAGDDDRAGSDASDPRDHRTLVDPVERADEAGDPGGETPTNRSVAVFALADGAGGHDAGDVAAYLATTAVCAELAPVGIRAARSDPGAFDVDVAAPLDPRPRPDDLEAAVAAAVVTAHREVLEYAAAAGRQAYTTVVAGVAVGGRLHYGWVGDSRAYLVNEARETITPVTSDHAVVEALAEVGELDDVEARVHPRNNEITRALGGTGDEDPETATVQVETDTVPVYAEDTVLVTSDGLVDAQTDARRLYERYVAADRDEAAAEHVRERVVTDGEIRDRVLGAPSLDRAAADLVALANDRGGKDNVSALLFRDPALAPTPDSLPDRSPGPDEPIEDRQTTIGDD